MINRYHIRKMLTETMFVVGLMISLQGCALVALVGAAGGGALVVTDRRTVGTQTEDRGIQIKALAQLGRNLPNTSHINVAVFNRHVLMTGEVQNILLKQKAEMIVGSISNVNSIINELAVQPASSFLSRTNDAYLEVCVKTALIAEKYISANNFKVVSERGFVYLMGLVTMKEANIAAAVTSQVPGVIQVVKVFQYIQPRKKL